jgi:hypothetical protein
MTCRLSWRACIPTSLICRTVVELTPQHSKSRKKRPELASVTISYINLKYVQDGFKIKRFDQYVQ